MPYLTKAKLSLKTLSSIISQRFSIKHPVIKLSEKSLVMSTDDYLDVCGGRWHLAYPIQNIVWDTPIKLGAETVNFGQSLARTFPELGVLETNHGYVVGTDGWLVTKEYIFLPEVSWFGKDTDLIPLPQKEFSVNKLKGVCLSLVSNWSSKAYGHFLLDALCRFKIFTEAGFTVRDVDYVLCPKPPSGNAEKILAKLNIPEHKIVWAEVNVATQADVTLAPSFPGVRRNCPTWAVEFLRELVKLPVSSTKRRLFVNRVGTTRQLENIESLKPILQKHNFEIYNPSESDNPPADFNQAEVVVGPQGSGLADLAFCQPGTKVVELIPSDHIFPYYYTLSLAADLKYSYIIGKSRKHRSASQFGPSPYDFVIDEPEFSSALSKVVLV